MTRAALTTTTLCIVDTFTHALAERAVALCLAQADFADAIFVSDRAPAVSGIRHIPIAPLESREAYSRFVIKDLLEHLRSEHVLLVQWDGYIVNPDAWTDEFLGYDYIGARWGFHRDGHDVGNGGFSLRSRRLLEALQDPEINAFEPEDDMICRRFRPMLESRHGIRFAPGDLADRFSFETTRPTTAPFGFHGLFNMWKFLSDEELPAFVGALPRASLGSLQLRQLARNLIDLKRPSGARAVLQSRLAAYPGDSESRALLDQLSPETSKPTGTERVSRNAACPCGSGKRFKHCCGAEGAGTGEPTARSTTAFDALVQQAFSHHQTGRLDEARAAYEAALAMQDDPLVSHYLGVLDMQKGQPAQGEARIRAALRERSDVADMHNNLGLCLRAQDRLDEAVRAYQAALDVHPGYAPAWSNIALDSHRMGRFGVAREAFDKALALSPNLPQTRFSRALLLLTLGDYRNGWSDYEHRARCPEYASHYRLPPMARAPAPWRGDQDDLSGKRLLLLGEQGIGDTIQFIRYARSLASRGAEVNLYVPKRETASLLATAPGISDVLTPGDPIEAHDYACFLMSLPRLCGTHSVDAIPSAERYLSADPEKSRVWRERLAALGADRLKIGLCWAGNPTHHNDRNRSCPPEQLAPLGAREDIDWICLQLGAGRERIGEVPMQLHDWTDGIADYADTAALMSELDLVITVDTSVAHAAGALGVPTWVLLPAVPDFRWLLEREDSPWYPSLRLFRQHAAGDWADVARRLADALASLRAREFRD